MRGEDAQDGARCGETWLPASGRGTWRASCSGREGVRMLPREGWTGIQEGAGEPRSETAEARFPDKGHTLKGWAGGQPLGDLGGGDVKEKDKGIPGGLPASTAIRDSLVGGHEFSRVSPEHPWARRGTGPAKCSAMHFWVSAEWTGACSGQQNSRSSFYGIDQPRRSTPACDRAQQSPERVVDWAQCRSAGYQNRTDNRLLRVHL